MAIGGVITTTILGLYWAFGPAREVVNQAWGTAAITFFVLYLAAHPRKAASETSRKAVTTGWEGISLGQKATSKKPCLLTRWGRPLPGAPPASTRFNSWTYRRGGESRN
jgi:hypothetical protein